VRCRHLKVHGCSNPYLAGSLVFLTSGASNPTLTIVALSYRLAEHVLNHGKRAMPTDRRISRRAFVAATALTPVLSLGGVAPEQEPPNRTGTSGGNAGGLHVVSGLLVLASDKPVLEMRGPAKPTRIE
jgi:hypothetical protein